MNLTTSDICTYYQPAECAPLFKIQGRTDATEMKIPTRDGE